MSMTELLMMIYDNVTFDIKLNENIKDEIKNILEAEIKNDLVRILKKIENYKDVANRNK